MHIGKAIKSIRLGLDISQNKLALDCDLSQTFLSQVEKGMKAPSPKTIHKICKAMEIPETLIHIVAIQEEDLPPCRRNVYRLVHPSITSLIVQMANAEPIEN